MHSLGRGSAKTESQTLEGVETSPWASRHSPSGSMPAVVNQPQHRANVSIHATPSISTL